MKEESIIEMMNELSGDVTEALEELLKDEIQPIVDYRLKMEQKVGNKEINEMYKLEEES